MNRFCKSLLLLGLQVQCQADRGRDWQALHRRDRKWFLAQKMTNRWELAHRWLQTFAAWRPIGFTPSAILVLAVGALFGAGLMSGLLQFQPQQRINLWWWLLLSVWLPALWWLIGLWLGRVNRRSGMAHAVVVRFLPNTLGPADTPLLQLTARALSQQVSLGFALGLLGTFVAYLLLTDLAFGWSSTLDVSAQGVHQFTQFLSLPWLPFLSSAVPTLEMVEQTRFFRVETVLVQQGNLAGQWWPFLLMNLLTYVLLPRLLSFLWSEWQLVRAQQRLFNQDGCIDGWWQRLHAEQVQQTAAPAPRNRGATLSSSQGADGPTESTHHAWPVLHALITAGYWSDDQVKKQVDMLPPDIQHLPQISEQQALEAASAGEAYLLLCKGWEPPTSALADLCQQLHEQQKVLFLWPAPLPGMKSQRTKQLRESWQLFMPQLPPTCHLLETPKDA